MLSFRNGLLLLLCLTVTFCSPHDETFSSLTEQADKIGFELSDPGGHRSVQDTPIVPGTTAGFLPATSAVTSTGEFVYTIPLDVPQGRAGMAPALSIVYTSHGANGLLGLGWRLDGFSEIHRCAKTFAQDGMADGIDFDDDGLCLDGERLVPINADGKEYRTEQDSMSRIVARGGDGQPTTFVVYRKDGRILEYTPIVAKREQHIQSSVTAVDVELAWPVSVQRDRAGNEMRYQYEVTFEGRFPYGIEYHPTAIYYTFQRNAGDTARRKVVFSYEDRPDPLFAYVSGVKLQTTKRLAAIEMHAPNPVDTELVWRYTLTYVNHKFRSRLGRVRKCGALGGCLLGKEFHYTYPSGPFFSRAYRTQEPSLGSVRLIFDADGDGKDDLLYRGLGGELYLRKTPRRGGPPLSQRILLGGDAGFKNLSIEDSKPVDIDADGIVELVGLVREKKEYRFFRWQGGGRFQSMWAPIQASEEAEWGKCRNWPPPEPVHFADLDGDALPDMVKTVDVARDPYRYQPAWYYWMNQGNGFGAPEWVPVQLDPPRCYNDVRRSWSASLDLFGDHRATLLIATAMLQYNRAGIVALRLNDGGKFADPKFRGTGRVYADLNGDGLRDGLKEWEDGQVSWNTGVGARKEPATFWPFAEDLEGEWHVADIDGDGDDDLLVMKGGETPKLVVFRYAPNQAADGTWAASARMKVIDGIAPGQLGDFDGDGFLDIVSFPGEDALEVHRQTGGPFELLDGIWDEGSRSPREEIVYRSNHSIRGPPSAGPRRATCRYPQRCIRQAIQVVWKHWRNDAGSRIYSYDDPRSDLRGRGFLGFGKVREWDPDRGKQTTTTYDHETRIRGTYPYALLPKEVLEVAPILEQPAPGRAVRHRGHARARIAKRINTYKTRWLHQDRTYFVHPEHWRSWEWEQDVDIDWDEQAGVHIEVPRRASGAPVLRRRSGSYRFDDYDNTVGESVVTESGGMRHSVVSAYEIREADWLVGLLHRREVTSSGATRTTEYAYDDRGLLTEIRFEPDNPDPDIPETVTFTRSSDDGQVSMTTRQAAGQPARRVAIDYDDERVFPTQVTNELGHISQFAYHPAYGTLGLELNANGVRTQRVYDDLGRLRSVVPQGGTNVRIGYEIAKDPTDASRPLRTRITVSDDAGGESFTIFDLWERPVVRARRGFGGEWIHRRIDYDSLGNVSVETRPGVDGPSKARTAYRYDSLDRLIEVFHPDGNRTQYRHTFLESHTRDAENHKSYLVRDADDRIVRSVQVKGVVEVPTTYTYREFDLVASIADPKGNQIEFDYDIRGRRTRVNHPDRGVTTFAYSGYGEVRERTDALNEVTTYERDVLGRVSRIHNADGVTEFVWDRSDHGIGLPATTTSPDGTRQTYRYDAVGRPEEIDWLVGGERFSVQMSHDAFGRLSTLGYPEAPGRPRLTVEHTYNATGFLAKVADISGAAAKPFWRVDGRNLDDALAQGTYGNGLVTERVYDDASGRLHKHKAGSIYSLVYGYDDIGFVQTRTDVVSSRRDIFAYDALHRLQSWRLQSDRGVRKTEYGYDDIGNLTEVLVDGKLAEQNQYGGAGSGAGPHAITASTAHGSFAYDARGRQTEGLRRHIKYTDFDLPREITTPSGVTSFGYDAAGVRVKKVGPAGTTISIGGLYERRTDPQGGITHVFYIQGSEGTVAQIVYDQASGQSETQYIITDALGSTALVTSEAGEEIERRYYAPFGQRIEESGRPISSPVTSVRLGFTGHRHDAELGLIDMRGRMYDPAIRRFVTPDPVISLPLFGQAYDTYSYSLNNPVNLVDPSGFQPMWWGTVPAWMCGNVPSWWYDPGGFALPSGPLGGFGGAPRSTGGSSAVSGQWLIPPPTSGGGSTGLSYADIWSRSLPSVSGPTAGVPNAALRHRSGSQQVRDFLLARYAQDRAAFDAYTDYLSTVALTAAAGPVLAYAGAGTLLGYAGVELAGLGAAQTAATVIGMGLGAHEVQQGIETGSKTRIAIGVLAGVPWLSAISRVRSLGAVAARGALVPKSAGAMESAFSVASRGGKHAGFLKRASGMSRRKLERTVRSFQRGIERHEGFLHNPASHVENWSSLRLEHQQSLIRHWQQEITTFAEQQSIINELLMRIP